MFIVMIRTAVLYILVVTIMRLMGKRQIGELQPFELVIAIMVSDLASIPMQDTRIPILHGIIPIVTLLILQIVVSVLQLKSERARILICGKPTILVHQGKINIDALRDQRFNINDLMEEIRLQGYFNLSDVHCAILETSGQLSIIPKSQVTPVTRDDLRITTSQDELPITLIMDGKVNKHSLELLNKNMDWLNNLLRENNVLSPRDIFVAIIDSKGKFFYQCKEGDEK